MGKRSFDPTTVAARRQASQQKLAHRIKLKKQLERARRRLDEATQAGASPSLDPAITEAIQSLRRRDEAPASPSPITATEPPRGRRQMHQRSKPDPMKAARELREQREQEKLQAIEQREREIKERQKAKERQAKQREQRTKKLTEKNLKGQPKLSNHIKALLSKIRKSG